MRFSNILIATVCLLVSGSITALSYARILEIERPHHTFLQGYLNQGIQNFIMSADDECIGEMHIDLHHEKATQVKATGYLKAKLNSTPIDVAIDSQEYFNPLGQMTDSATSLKSSLFKVSAVTTGIHPLKANLIFEASEKKLNFNREVPGPLVISEYSPLKFQLEYFQALPLQPIAVQGPTALLSGEYNLSIKRKPPGFVCDPHHRLDLSKVIDRIESMIGQKNKSVNHD